MDKIKIREAKEEDLDFLYEIESQDVDSWSYEILKQDLLKNEFSNYFVAELEGKIVGFISIMNIVRELHINNIIVNNEYRNKGIGEKLLKYGMSYYPKEEIFGVTLEVRVDNFPAIALYKKLGFSEAGRRPNYYKNNKDAIIMWKFFEEIEC